MVAPYLDSDTSVDMSTVFGEGQWAHEYFIDYETKEIYDMMNDTETRSYSFQVILNGSDDMGLGLVDFILLPNYNVVTDNTHLTEIADEIIAKLGARYGELDIQGSGFDMIAWMVDGATGFAVQSAYQNIESGHYAFEVMMGLLSFE